MTTTEMQTDPWGGSPRPARLGRLRQYANTIHTAVLITVQPGLTFGERLDYLDYHCAPSWTWTLRNWWRANIRHRRGRKAAEELHQQVRAEFDKRIAQAETDEQFWLIVDDPNY